ncbi:MAG TPA: DNA polymerase III subunit beta [Candidatus Saccharimonadales bacterium]|nr:DNA polymerase III subunit beta [Candidatus Saccharimonadales bacterium]
MKLTVTQENLNRALQVVGRVASGKTPLPILNNILFKVTGNRLMLAATNLELAITQHVGSKIDQEGSITVPARLMSEFIANLPKGNVELEAEGTKLHIRCGTYTSTINGMAPDEFPELPSIEEKQAVTIPVTDLKRGLQQTVLVASSDDTRPVLTGVFCHSFEGHMYLAATDGYRLAERRLIATSQDISAIVPVSTLNDVLRVVHDDMNEVKLVFDENQVRILLDDVEITSRLIDGSFPDYRTLIPKQSDIAITLQKDEFVRVAKVASLFARESGGSVTLNGEASSNTLRIHSVASQLGENTSEVTATVTADTQVTLNSRYLLEALGCIDAKQVLFHCSGKLAACVLTPAGDAPDYQHIIMPLKS